MMRFAAVVLPVSVAADGCLSFWKASADGDAKACAEATDPPTQSGGLLGDSSNDVSTAVGTMGWTGAEECVEDLYSATWPKNTVSALGMTVTSAHSSAGYVTGCPDACEKRYAKIGCTGGKGKITYGFTDKACTTQATMGKGASPESADGACTMVSSDFPAVSLTADRNKSSIKFDCSTKCNSAVSVKGEGDIGSGATLQYATVGALCAVFLSMI